MNMNKEVEKKKRKIEEQRKRLAEIKKRKEAEYEKNWKQWPAVLGKNSPPLQQKGT